MKKHKVHGNYKRPRLVNSSKVAFTFTRLGYTTLVLLKRKLLYFFITCDEISRKCIEHAMLDISVIYLFTGTRKYDCQRNAGSGAVVTSRV